MNLKDILHGLISRTSFANEVERESFHAAVDNLDLASGEESTETSEEINPTNENVNLSTEDSTPFQAPGSSTESQGGSETSNGPGA